MQLADKGELELLPFSVTDWALALDEEAYTVSMETSPGVYLTSTRCSRTITGNLSPYLISALLCLASISSNWVANDEAQQLRAKRNKNSSFPIAAATSKI